MVASLYSSPWMCLVPFHHFWYRVTRRRLAVLLCWTGDYCLIIVSFFLFHSFFFFSFNNFSWQWNRNPQTQPTIQLLLSFCWHYGCSIMHRQTPALVLKQTVSSCSCNVLSKHWPGRTQTGTLRGSSGTGMVDSWSTWVARPLHPKKAQLDWYLGSPGKSKPGAFCHINPLSGSRPYLITSMDVQNVSQTTKIMQTY